MEIAAEVVGPGYCGCVEGVYDRAGAADYLPLVDCGREGWRGVECHIVANPVFILEFNNNLGSGRDRDCGAIKREVFRSYLYPLRLVYGG